MATDDLPIDPDLGPDVDGVRRPEPAVLAVIAAGGMLGATVRYVLARVLPIASGEFPWATFWTNLSGSFVLGLLLIVLLERVPGSCLLRPFLTTGIIGAFTTMSTFAVETALLVKDGSATTGFVYVIVSIAGGLALAYAGITVGRRVPARRIAG